VTDPCWAGRRVLITGATGFIGTTLGRRLTEAGALVSGVARRRPERAVDLELHTVDLSELAGCRALIERERPDAVLHTAGHPYAARELGSVVPTFRDNLETTVNLLVSTAEARVPRVVLCGSLEEPESDEVAAALSSPYAISKAAATNYARLFHDLYGHPVVVARLFMVYGPGQWALSKLIPSTILTLLRGEAPKVSSGERPVDWVYIDDVVDGILACAVAPGVEGQRIDIGTGVLTTVRGVVEAIGGLIPQGPAPAFGTVPNRSAEQVRAARVDRTQALLGWKAKVDLLEGLRRTVEWYQNQPRQAGS
jgi:UDP-glucose 4-epimerase